MTSPGWPLRPLGECAKFLSGGTPSKTRAEFWAGDIPWVSSGEMCELRIDDTPLHVSEEGAREGSKLVPANTVLAVVRGMSLAKEFRIAVTRREVAFNQDLKALECEPDVDPAFLFYALLARRDHIRDLASEAAHGTKRLETDVLAAFEIPIPHTTQEQRRVVAVLVAYDDLIENNRRRMVLLEEAARQLYREWFVRLRFPGHEHTRIVDGVPEGWERRSLVDCVKFLSGGTPSKQRSEYWEGEIPWVSSGEMTDTRMYDTKLHVSPEGAEIGSRLVPAGTILIVVRGMSLAKEFRLATTAREMSFNQDLKALECRDGVDSQLVFHSLLARRDHIRELASEAAHGTKKLESAVLEDLPVVIPTAGLQRQFREAVEPLNRQRDNVHQQNTRLRAARDLLLPRLMSGELAV